MKKLTGLLAATSLSFLFAMSTKAVEPVEKPDTTAAKELKNQTHCPVMGGEIDSSYYTDIQGQRIYHCCPMCSKKLKADPDKYFKKAAEEGILFENIQTECPVSGMKLKEKKIYTDYEGRRIYFCSDECRSAFDKNPQKYLSKLDEMSGESEGAEKHDDSGMKHHKHDN
jgi:YHS domain-containing protein